MAQSYNPFDVLELRLNSIENLLLDIKHKYVSAPPQQADQWFDLNELCNYLPDKPATATVYGWVHTSQIPYHKGTSKKLRFLKSQIDIWLLQGRKKTFAETASEADKYLLKRKGGVNHG
jgi:hypothetical protein